MNKQRILLVATNTATYGDLNKTTGLWLSEAVQFHNLVVEAGYEIDYVSPNGGYVPIDHRSLRMANAIDLKWYRNNDYRQKYLANSLTPEQVDPNQYDAIYYTGGHGVMWDFPDNLAIQKIAETIYQNGGYITSVCHGGVGLLNLHDENDEWLIKDKHLTSFTNWEERLNLTTNRVPFLTETALKKRGAIFKQHIPFTPFVVSDGRLITGQNPESPKKVAQTLIQQLEK